MFKKRILQQPELIRKIALKRKVRNIKYTVVFGMVIALVIGISVINAEYENFKNNHKVLAEELPIQIQGVDTTMISTPWRTIPTLKNGSPEQNEKIAYAYKISGHNKEFIYVLNGENGLFDHTRVHDSSANTIGVDYGLCGINSYFHPQIVNDPKFQDWKWQMDTCYQLWDGGVTFYGYNKKGIMF